MSNVPRSTPELESALNQVNDASDLREILLSKMAEGGQIIRTRDDAFNNRLIRQPETTPQPAVVMPANPATCVRTIYPAGNNRFEIYGASEQELDERERQIRAMFRST